MRLQELQPACCFVELETGKHFKGSRGKIMKIEWLLRNYVNMRFNKIHFQLNLNAFAYCSLARTHTI
jgi:hypothetical protein